MRRIVLVAVWISVAASVAGFMMPWVFIRSGTLSGQVGQVMQETGLDSLTKGFRGKVSKVTLQFKRGAQTIVGDLPDLSTLPGQVNGPGIPAFVNRTDNTVAIALAEMLSGQTDISKKSYAVYLLPGLALLIGLLLTALSGAPPACWTLAALSAGVAGAGFWKLLTTHINSMAVTIVFGQGLWVSLWAYAGLAACAALLALIPRAR